MPSTLDDPGGPTLRTQRLKLTWLLALPFLYLSRPSPTFLFFGAAISILGLVVRTLAAGAIHKDRELATGGAYHYLRHPLYLGSFLVGLGLALAGGRWWFPFVFGGLFFWIYRRTIRAEEARLAHRFGKAYASYHRRVPSVIPRLTRPPAADTSPGFRFRLYSRNKEWQAALGSLLGYGLLWVKMSLLG